MEEENSAYGRGDETCGAKNRAQYHCTALHGESAAQRAARQAQTGGKGDHNHGQINLPSVHNEVKPQG